MSLLANVIAFKVAWVSSVIGAAQEMPWLGPLAVLFAVALHLRTAHKPFDEILLILASGLIGAGFDSLLVNSGWVSYSSGLFSPWLAPYWIITMWMLSATTLNVSMRWLRGRPAVAAVLGLIGGPAAYTAGEAMGGIVLVNQPAAIAALAIGWACIMPLLVWLASHLDGMPGARRKWLTEGTA